MLNNEQMSKIEKAINESELWQRLNRNIKALYERENRVPSTEEYQALRTMLICKTILNDPEARAKVSDEVFKALQEDIKEVE